jgi:hypothetical protein
MAGDDAAQVSRAGSTDVTEATAVTAVSFDSGVQFNNKMFKDWSAALSAIRQLKKKNQDVTTSSWYRTVLIVEQDDSFALRCSTCHKNLDIRNTANFWSSHKKTCGVSKEGTEFTRGMPRPLLYTY